jgi:hypothetical protein
LAPHDTPASLRNKNRLEMLADAPDVDGSTRAAEERSKGDSTDERGLSFPVRRLGLEQEFFLVDLTGALCDLADRFLRRCWDAAETEGLDPRCFKTECAKGLVEITTPPSSGFDDLTRNYQNNLNLALEVASELGLGLYPLDTYPLPIRPEVRDDPSYRLQARIIGHERFLHAGRCAGTHLHLELPAGSVWPDMKTALDAPVAVQEEFLVFGFADACRGIPLAGPAACSQCGQGSCGEMPARRVFLLGSLLSPMSRQRAWKRSRPEKG